MRPPHNQSDLDIKYSLLLYFISYFSCEKYYCPYLTVVKIEIKDKRTMI